MTIVLHLHLFVYFIVAVIPLIESATSESYHLSDNLKKTIQQKHDAAIQAAQRSYFFVPPHSHDVEQKEQELSDKDFTSLPLPDTSVIPDYHTFFHNPCIHISSKPLLSAFECESMINAADEYFQNNPTLLQSGRFKVRGVWIKECQKLHKQFNLLLEHKLYPTLAKLFPDFVKDISDLVCDNAYLFRYTPETGERTDVHTDSGCLSFTIALNKKEDYQGGGTWFDALDDVIEMDQGQITFRPGGIRHRGEAVLSGVRYIIGGFVMSRERVEMVRMLNGIAIALMNENKFEQAEEALRVAILLNPKFETSYTTLADMLVKQEKRDEAMGVLNTVLSNNPRNGEASYSLGVLLKEKGNVDHARECFNTCLKVDPFDTESMMAQALLAQESGKTEDEKHWFSKIISTPGVKAEIASSAYSHLGIIIGEQTNDKEAEIAMYQKALNLDPKSFHALYCLGLTYGATKEYDKAIPLLHNAISNAATLEKKSQCLQTLYKIVARKVNENEEIMKNPKEDILNEMIELMGRDHYEQLLLLMRKR